MVEAQCIIQLDFGIERFQHPSRSAPCKTEPGWNLYERIAEIDERLESNWYRSPYEASWARIEKLGMERDLARDEEERKRRDMLEEDRRRGR